MLPRNGGAPGAAAAGGGKMKMGNMEFDTNNM